MTANEIRNLNPVLHNKTAFLQEIAAQLAELNEKLTPPAMFGGVQPPDPYQPSDQDRHEDSLPVTPWDEQSTKELHLLLMEKPTSDPSKLVRCSWCTQEMPRPKEGKLNVCDNCIPF